MCGKDTTGDGIISRKEFARAMKELGLEVPVAVINKFFDDFDTTGDHQLDYNELAAMLRKG